MANKIQIVRSETTGQKPTTTGPADIGEISVNIIDKKIYVRDSAGVAQLVSDRLAEYDDTLVYEVGDFCVEGLDIYRCIADVTPEPFDPTKWESLTESGGGGNLDDAVILAPATQGRNTITTPADAEGLIIEGDPLQTENLLEVRGTQAGDNGAWAIDALGFPNARGGAVAWRQTESSHLFTANGQPAAYNGTSWVPANASDPGLTTYALVQEIIDSNTLVMRAGGIITGLEPAAFAGGVVVPGEVYFVSDVPGVLTLTPPLAKQEALLALTGTTGLVLLSARSIDPGVDFLPTTGGVMTGNIGRNIDDLEEVHSDAGGTTSIATVRGNINVPWRVTPAILGAAQPDDSLTYDATNAAWHIGDAYDTQNDVMTRQMTQAEVPLVTDPLYPRIIDPTFPFNAPNERHIRVIDNAALLGITSWDQLSPTNDPNWQHHQFHIRVIDGSIAGGPPGFGGAWFLQSYSYGADLAIQYAIGIPAGNETQVRRKQGNVWTGWAPAVDKGTQVTPGGAGPPYYGARAWVRTNNFGFISGQNIAAVQNVGASTRVVFAVPMPDLNYSVVITQQTTNTGQTRYAVVTNQQFNYFDMSVGGTGQHIFNAVVFR